MDDIEQAPLVELPRVSNLSTSPRDPTDDNSHPRSSMNSDINSERTSILGESVLYEDHLDELALSERNSVLSKMKLEISIYSLVFIACLAVSLLANGMFISPVVATTGCWIGLNSWAYGLCLLVLAKLVI